MAKITKFWMVTKATPVSEIDDIFGEYDLAGLRLQFLGGLRIDKVVGVWDNEAEARKEAEKQLKTRPKTRMEDVSWVRAVIESSTR